MRKSLWRRGSSALDHERAARARKAQPHATLTPVSSTFGVLFRIATFGESHGPAVGVVIDGCPPRLPLAAEDIQVELDRRRPGQSRITTQRKEADQVEILSGVHDGLTQGTPIAMLVRNSDQRSADYEEMQTKYRPSHADYTYQAKYGIRAWEGGGRASARETIGRVAAGAVARKLLAQEAGRGDRRLGQPGARPGGRGRSGDRHAATPSRRNIVRCPDPAMAEQMIARIDGARKDGDSLGGVVEAVARGVPAGLGEPVFDKLEADLAKAMLSLPACKGFEIGSGFAGTRLTGSQHNDPFYNQARPHPHPHQPLGRHPGRHLQRRGHRHPRGLQADRHHPARAADRRRRTATRPR